MPQQRRHAPNPACRQCHGTGRTRYATWHEDDTWTQGEESDCWCVTARQYPDPDCPHCHGTGEIERQVRDFWAAPPTRIKAPCRCMQGPSQPDPFPDRPDNGDGLPDPDRIDYTRTDYP